MIVLDRLLTGTIRFVLTRIADAVDAELNDGDRLREELLAAQMRLELGQMSEDEFAVFEAAILSRLREIKGRERALGAEALKGARISGAEVSFGGDPDVQ